MSSWKTPTQAQVDKAVVAIAHPARRRYFFDRLENPRWIVPLHKRGLFDDPPAPVRDEKEGTVQSPPWPQSRFLARMAEHDPQNVITIIDSISEFIARPKFCTSVSIAWPVSAARTGAKRMSFVPSSLSSRIALSRRFHSPPLSGR